MSQRQTKSPCLRRQRLAAGLSQSELAARAGINIRNIQQYEQRAKDINRAAAISLQSLARVLGCRIESLLEPDNSSTSIHADKGSSNPPHDQIAPAESCKKSISEIFSTPESSKKRWPMSSLTTIFRKLSPLSANGLSSALRFSSSSIR